MDLRSRFAICALAVVLALTAGQGHARSVGGEPVFRGVWRNPRDTIRLELRPCGVFICGHVIWASDVAKAAAARINKRELVGQQLLRDFMLDDDGIARGRAYVPDLGLTFKGSARHVDRDTIRIKGCVVSNLICRSQVWNRVTDAALPSASQP